MDNLVDFETASSDSRWILNCSMGAIDQVHSGTIDLFLYSFEHSIHKETLHSKASERG